MCTCHTSWTIVHKHYYSISKKYILYNRAQLNATTFEYQLLWEIPVSRILLYNKHMPILCIIIIVQIIVYVLL